MVIKKESGVKIKLGEQNNFKLKRSGTIRKSSQVNALMRDRSKKSLVMYDDASGSPGNFRGLKNKSIKTSVNTSTSVIKGTDTQKNKDLDSQYNNFYQPISLQDRENMVEFLEDSDEQRRNFF